MDHDALSKFLFALPNVEADALRIVARRWVHLLDLSTLERLSAEHPAADLTQRIGDLTWRVRFRVGQLADGSRPWRGRRRGSCSRAATRCLTRGPGSWRIGLTATG